MFGIGKSVQDSEKVISICKEKRKGAKAKGKRSTRKSDEEKERKSK